MKNNGLKNAKAITLIALIVSIIVILILAGVSIAVLTGENGLLNRATSAKQTNEQKTAEEELKLGVSALSIDYRKNTTNSQTFREFVTSENGMTKLKQAMGLDTNNQELKVENATNGVVSYKGQKYQLDDFGGMVEYKPVSVKINVGGTEREITADDDMSLYYGTVVTNYTTGGTYRIFYIDFAGKYGEKGTIYLKADYDSTRTDTLDTAFSSSTLVKEMNPDWAKETNRGNTTSDNWNNNEKVAAYLCDPTNSNNATTGMWKDYFDGNNAKYVIGAPSIEMYCDSYNQVSHTGIGVVGNNILGTIYRDDSNITVQEPGAPPNLKRAQGYIYTIGNPPVQSSISNSDYSTGDETLDYTQYGCMYASSNVSNTDVWWLASPSAYYAQSVCIIYGTSLSKDGFGRERVLCPLVSLKATFIPAIAATNN